MHAALIKFELLAMNTQIFLSISLIVSFIQFQGILSCKVTPCKTGSACCSGQDCHVTDGLCIFDCISKPPSMQEIGSHPPGIHQ